MGLCAVFPAARNRGNNQMAWLPAAGTVADLGTDTVDSVAGRTTNFWKTYSGIGWAPWWGAYGSVLALGGGHSDGEINDIYRIDIGTQSITRIKTPATSYPKTYGAATLNGDPDSGWMWANATVGDTTVQTGELHADHHYQHLVCIPGSAIPGGGATNGYLCKPGTVSMPPTGGYGTARLCAIRLGVDNVWTHIGSGDTQQASHGGAVYDPARNRIWYRPDTLGLGTSIYYKEIDGSGESTLSISGTSFTSQYFFWAFDQTSDSLILWAPEGDHAGVYLRIFDPDTGTQYQPAITGSAPPSLAWRAACWSDSWRCLVVYPGTGGTTIYFLTPGVDPRVDDWSWSSQTFTGTARSLDTNPSGGGQGYNRLQHVASLGNVLVWCSQSSLPVQLIHLSSAP